MRKIKYKIKNDDLFKELRSELFRKGEDLGNFDSIKEVEDGRYLFVKRDEQGRKTKGYIDIFQDIREQGYQVKLKRLNKEDKYKTPVLCGYDKNKVSIGASLDLLAKNRFGKNYFANHFKEGMPLELYNTLRGYLSSLSNEEQKTDPEYKSKHDS